MPLVTITVRTGKSSAFKSAILDGVHRALIASGVPEKDRFQRVLELGPDDFRFDPEYPHLTGIAQCIAAWLSRRRSHALTPLAGRSAHEAASDSHPSAGVDRYRGEHALSCHQERDVCGDHRRADCRVSLLQGP